MFDKWKRGALGCMFAFCMLGAQAGTKAIESFDPDSLARIVERHKGTPFVLVVWSLDCVYCATSMQTLAQEKRKHTDLKIVTLSTDSANDPEAVALMKERLASVGMLADAWAFGTAPQEQLRYALDPKWRGEKPRSYWFDAQGGRVAYSGVITPEVIARYTGQQG